MSHDNALTCTVLGFCCHDVIIIVLIYKIDRTTTHGHNINNLLHLYSAFLDTQSSFNVRGCLIM